MFYTYCPALDQFVDSSLNRGLYPPYYLSANLAFLERNAALARKYGLVPGLLCFEPRSVPEEFFARYPMLRGARVDHPFRSFKPRYTMTLAHPLVRDHYAEMVRRLLEKVPDLGFLTIWSNDSGSGFEHTTSLYVGRNGGPYMVREWRDHAAIARIAGEHALLFFRTLRDAARAVSPGFRVITRLESFMGEHETLWGGLGDGVEVETNSLVARGWAMPYTHPRYPDSHSINGGTVFQAAFDDRERDAAGRPPKPVGHGPLLHRRRPAPDVRAAHRHPVSPARARAAIAALTGTACGNCPRSAAPARPNSPRSTSTTRSSAASSSTPGWTSARRSRAWLARGPATTARRRSSKPGGSPRKPSSPSRTCARSTRRSGSRGTASGPAPSCRTSRRSPRPSASTTSASCAPRRTTRTTSI